MARQPSDAKIVSDIISQLEGIEPEGLAEKAAKAREIRQTKITARQQEFYARVREEAAALDIAPATLASMLVAAEPRSTPASKQGDSGLPVKYRDGANYWKGRSKKHGPVPFF